MMAFLSYKKEEMDRLFKRLIGYGVVDREGHYRLLDLSEVRCLELADLWNRDDADPEGKPFSVKPVYRK